ncbi:MAG: energy-coupling factor transporter transmembrane protein EcfT [Euryarchaeota archaeon]|nr:energy-coupling factor transporter transmembrane protein EcfT [Euryarchaeota archaeon]
MTGPHAAPYHTPTVFPRILLAAAATLVALIGPAWGVAVVAAAAGIGLVRSGAHATARTTGWMVLGLVAATIVFQAAILVPFVGLGWLEALGVGAAFSARLGTVLLVTSLLAVALPPRAWLASLARFPRLGLLFTLVFRQVPDMAAEAERVRRAQRARGLLIGRLVPALATVVPVMSRTLERADRMGRVLLLAGWGRPRREPLVRPRFHVVDIVWMGLAVALLAGLFLF